MPNRNNAPSNKNIGIWRLAIVALIAAIYRGVHLYFWSKTPWFRLPSLDEIYHHNWASYIAEGNLLFPTAFFRAPFYSYFLGGIYAFGGTNPWTVRIIQLLFGVFGCIMVAILAKKVFDDRRVGLLAGIFIALSPMPALFESRLLLDWMLIPLGALALIFLVDASRDGRGRNIFLFGLSSGFFAITRPNILAVFPFLLLWLVLRRKKIWLKAIGLALVGISLPVLPVFVHNLARGEASLVATQGGLNLYLGNNAETDGMTPVLPGHGGTWTVREAWKMAEREAGRELSSSGMSDWYLSKTIGYLKENPGDELRLLARKAGLLLSPVEHGNNGSPEFFKRYSPPLKSHFAWGLFLILATAGLPIILRKRETGALILWGIIYGATIVLFFVNARFRLPMLVAVVPFSASGTVILYDLLREKRIGQFIFQLLLPIIMVLGFMITYDGNLTERGKAESYFALGNIHLREGKLAKADSAYAEALSIMPELNRVNLNRGIIAFRKENHFLAEDYFHREIENRGEISNANSNLGVISRLYNDTSQAIRYGANAIKVDPINTQAYINYAQTLVELGFPDTGLVIALKGLELDSLNRRLLLSAGAAYMKMGVADSAKTFFEKASRVGVPGALLDYELSGVYSVEGAGASSDSVIRGYAYYNLGLIEASRGKLDYSRAYFRKALDLNPHHAEAWASYGGVLSRLGMDEAAEKTLLTAIERGYNSPEIYYNLGLIYARKGKYNRALNQFQKSIEITPNFKAAIEKIELIKKLEQEGKIFLEKN